MALFHKEYRLVPALIWSLAGTVRSNALLWTGFFAWDAINEIIYSTRRDFLRTIRRVTFLGLCGVVSVTGFAWWQYSAWEQYCTSSIPEQWCSNSLPLIYSHVQKKYWSKTLLTQYLSQGYWIPSLLDSKSTPQLPHRISSPSPPSVHSIPPLPHKTLLPHIPLKPTDPTCPCPRGDVIPFIHFDACSNRYESVDCVPCVVLVCCSKSGR